MRPEPTDQQSRGQNTATETVPEGKPKSTNLPYNLNVIQEKPPATLDKESKAPSESQQVQKLLQPPQSKPQMSQNPSKSNLL